MVNESENNFIMSPKIDFAFKLLFGNSKNIDILIALLSAILKLPINEFVEIEIMDEELLHEFKEDKKEILDVKVTTKEKKRMDIRIHIFPHGFIPEKTMFYWANMYISGINSVDTCNKLKKCITINIADSKYTPLKGIHTTYHITEDKTGYKLTDVPEIHFIELSKLLDEEVMKDENEAIVQWMEFIGAKSEEVMEVLAEKNEDIKKAYNLLKIISKDEKARMLYEVRQAEISDQLLGY
ncbi:Rpn family recombination-promoting nuclease/putative transposase [Clostridium sp. WILCCON 0269]|uniref:Rpn family recombination-promoting nuclease/putative transposase n=1 Tax=Candidatus Clostridium eludens TaxID=3381663 RepID=A0ABW8SVB8_9CLOT